MMLRGRLSSKETRRRVCEQGVFSGSRKLMLQAIDYLEDATND